MGDGDSKIDAKKRTGDPQFDAQATFVQTLHGHLPASPALESRLGVRRCFPSAEDTKPIAPDPIAEDPIAALQRQLKEQRIWSASLKSLLEEHRSAQLLWNAWSEERNASLEERNASLAERVGKLEVSGKAVAKTGVIMSVSPDAREATGDQPEADASLEDSVDKQASWSYQAKWSQRRMSFPWGTTRRQSCERQFPIAIHDPDVTVDGADTAEPEQTCDLDESMWDCALLLGRPDLGVSHVITLWAVLVLLLNMLLQTTIAVIVLYMDDPTFKAQFIEQLWCATEPRFASACRVICFCAACNLL